MNVATDVVMTRNEDFLATTPAPQSRFTALPITAEAIVQALAHAGATTERRAAA